MIVLATMLAVILVLAFIVGIAMTMWLLNFIVEEATGYGIGDVIEWIRGRIR